MIYVNVDSPNLDFPYFNVFGEAKCKKNLYLHLKTPFRDIYI